MRSNIPDDPPEGKTPDDLLSHKAAARRLNMSPSWLYASGIPVVRIGRSRRYRTRDLDEYVESRVHRSFRGGDK